MNKTIELSNQYSKQRQEVFMRALQYHQAMADRIWEAFNEYHLQQ